MVYCRQLYSAGKDETKVEKLHSIIAQMEYTYQINTWHAKGISFKHHVHVPEVHPITGYEFCEREDEGHIFKVNRCSAKKLLIKHYMQLTSILVRACGKVVHIICSLNTLKKLYMILRLG